MLAGFLTTALEILIILDICGAVVYFALSGLIKSKDPKPEFGLGELQPAYPNRLQPCPAGGMPPEMYSASPSPTPSAAAIYAAPAAPPEAPERTGFCAGLKHRIASLKGKFAYRKLDGTLGVERVSLESEQKRLGQVLDSFKEET